MALDFKFFQETDEVAFWSFFFNKLSKIMLKPFSEVDICRAEADFSLKSRIDIADFIGQLLNLWSYGVIVSNKEMCKDDSDHNLMHLNVNLRKKYFYILERSFDMGNGLTIRLLHWQGDVLKVIVADGQIGSNDID
jgi:hypothetical protein